MSEVKPKGLLYELELPCKCVRKQDSVSSFLTAKAIKAHFARRCRLNLIVLTKPGMRDGSNTWR